MPAAITRIAILVLIMPSRCLKPTGHAARRSTLGATTASTSSETPAGPTIRSASDGVPGPVPTMTQPLEDLAMPLSTDWTNKLGTENEPIQGIRGPALPRPSTLAPCWPEGGVGGGRERVAAPGFSAPRRMPIPVRVGTETRKAVSNPWETLGAAVRGLEDSAPLRGVGSARPRAWCGWRWRGGSGNRGRGRVHEIAPSCVIVRNAGTSVMKRSQDNQDPR